MILTPFTGPGSTPARKRYWAQIADAVNASRKIAGRGAAVDEHPGSGSFINFRGVKVGACCFCDGTCIFTTEENCFGYYQGDGTHCIDCHYGGCCHSGFCDDCTSLDDCQFPNTYLGDGVICDPPDESGHSASCPHGACCTGPALNFCSDADASTCEWFTEQGYCFPEDCVYHGDGSSCDDGPCTYPSGACCWVCAPGDPNPYCCDQETSLYCFNVQGGVAWIEGEACDDSYCGLCDPEDPPCVHM